MLSPLSHKNNTLQTNPKKHNLPISNKQKSKDSSPGSSCLKLDVYDSQDDLEKLLRTSTNNSNTPNERKNTELEEDSHSIDNRRQLKLKKFDSRVFNSYRLLNSLTIIILLLTFYSTTISQIKNKKEFSFIIEFLRRDKIQAESNLIVLSIAFCLITCKIFLIEIRKL